MVEPRGENARADLHHWSRVRICIWWPNTQFPCAKFLHDPAPAGACEDAPPVSCESLHLGPNTQVPIISSVPILEYFWTARGPDVQVIEY